MEKARQRLAFETNIVELIKSKRLVKLALEHLLPSKKHRQLEKQARFTLIDPDYSSEDGCDDSDDQGYIKACNESERASDND